MSVHAIHLHGRFTGQKTCNTTVTEDTPFHRSAKSTNGVYGRESSNQLIVKTYACHIQSDSHLHDADNASHFHAIGNDSHLHDLDKDSHFHVRGNDIHLHDIDNDTNLHVIGTS